MAVGEARVALDQVRDPAGPPGGALERVQVLRVLEVALELVGQEREREVEGEQPVGLPGERARRPGPEARAALADEGPGLGPAAGPQEGLDVLGDEGLGDLLAQVDEAGHLGAELVGAGEPGPEAQPLVAGPPVVGVGAEALLDEAEGAGRVPAALVEPGQVEGHPGPLGHEGREEGLGLVEVAALGEGLAEPPVVRPVRGQPAALAQVRHGALVVADLVDGPPGPVAEAGRRREQLGELRGQGRGLPAPAAPHEELELEGPRLEGEAVGLLEAPEERRRLVELAAAERGHEVPAQDGDQTLGHAPQPNGTGAARRPPRRPAAPSRRGAARPARARFGRPRDRAGRSRGRSRRVTTIRSLVRVRDHPTVVRLDEALEADWITAAYHVTPDVGAHLEALRRTLGAPGGGGAGAFLIGPYGAGKSHFLAYLIRRLRAGALVEAPPEVAFLSLLNFPAESRLEDVVGGLLDVPRGGGDRRVAWAEVMERHPRGLLLVVDELSEFLRSKPTPAAFNEDVRFLQFLGEWAQGARLFVVAAMQEAIERTGDLEHGLYLKIKDRFPLRMRLTPTHVRDLLAEHLLVKEPGAAERVRELAARLREALPAAPLDEEDLVALYPIHPATLELLEEVRDRFSQTRGVVDFVARRLGGDPVRQVAPFLDRPFGELLTPDHVVLHFEDVLELQPEAQALAQQVFPWYRRHLDALFEAPGLRDVAAACVRLLALVHLSPAREALAVDEACWWLVFAPSRLDPARNREVLRRVLDGLADRGRYVRRTDGGYALAFGDDGAGRLERLLERSLADLPGPEVCFELLAEELGGRLPGCDPFELPRDRWQRRAVRWCFHERACAVRLEGAGGGPAPTDGAAELALGVRVPWGRGPAAEAGAPAPPGVFTVEPPPLELSPLLRELAALVRLRPRALGPETSRRLEQRIAERAAVFAGQLREAFQRARLRGPDGRAEAAPPLEPDTPFGVWVERCAVAALRRTYPSFERFAPSHGPLPHEAYRQLHRHLQERDLGAREAPEWVEVIREAYLVPMKLLARAGDGYAVKKRLDRHELVRLLEPLLEHEPAPESVYAHLAAPVYGLVPDQVHLVLIVLFAVGEVDIVKGGRSLRELHETLPTPRPYDRIVPGRALGDDAIRALGRLSAGLGHRAPAAWTVMSQQRAARAVRAAVAERSEALRALEARLRDEPAGELAAELQELLGWCATLTRGEGELAAFEQFLYEVGSADRFLERLERLAALPERLDRRRTERDRLAHLVGQAGLVERAGELGPAPGLGEGERLDAWLRRAEALHDAYAREYVERHRAWWEAFEVPDWEPPRVARSRHLGLDDALRTAEEARAALRTGRCRRAPDLRFQTRCPCGFDGEQAPAAVAARAALDEARGRVEEELAHFFAQDRVRSRVRAWLTEGLEVDPEAQRFVEGAAPWPGVEDLAAFDEHLAGVEVVRRVGVDELVDALGGRSWAPEDLAAAFADLVRRGEAARVRLEGAAPAPEPDAVGRWCLEQALRRGVPLPPGLGDLSLLAPDVEPAWLSAAALERLEALGLDDPVRDRALQLVADGRVEPPARPSPLVAAAAEVARPSAGPLAPARLAALAANLYGAHRVLRPLLGRRWLERLDALAVTPLDAEPPELEPALEAHHDRGWVVVDALGLAALEPLTARLEELFPGWRLAGVEFAAAGPRTTTAAFYDRLAGLARPHAFEKVDALDGLLHERPRDLEHLLDLAAAELKASLRRVRPRLDPSRPLLVFGDHGFRLDPSGARWTHGGPSTLERVVPLLRLDPVQT